MIIALILVMSLLKQLVQYLNPIARFGNATYSYIFPAATTLFFTVAVELYVNFILKNPNAVGVFAIFIFATLIVYFSFRDGVLGGYTVTTITLGYYIYLIVSLHYKGQQFISGVDTTIALGIVYFFISAVIGWLKQTIDKLIEREANEKRGLQTIIEQLPVGILITDDKGKITQGNKQAENILDVQIPIGFQVGSENLVPSTYKSQPLNPTRTPLLQVLKTGKAITYKEFILHRTNGKNRYLQVGAAPIHNRIGKIFAAALIFSDITEKKEAEERKDDFVNMASHELKTPVTSIKLYIDVLIGEIKQYHNEKANKILNNIKSQTNNLQELVNDLLDVSRLQTGKLTFKKETFRLDTFLAETLDELRGLSDQQIIFTNKSRMVVHADTFRIYQVLTNLISNAIKYSSGNGDIVITLKRKDGNALVSIQDFGIGIAKNQQKKIFDRLYQVTDAKEKTFPGFGMGLYISREIIKRHHGKIWVESEKDKGSTFFFSLPLVK